MSTTRTCSPADPAFDGTLLKKGSDNLNVCLMQTYLNALAAKLPALKTVSADGKFGSKTEEAVKQYQKEASLKEDGIIGKDTWDSIVCCYNANYALGADTYPGMALRPGTRGVSVKKMQQLLNQLAVLYTAIPTQKEDGITGNNTAAAVRLFQKQFHLKADGIIGQTTWDAIICVQRQQAAGTPEKVCAAYDGNALRLGAEGDSVRILQSYLNRVSEKNEESAPKLVVDGKFGKGTKEGVMVFQARYGLSIDGVVGKETWTRLVLEFNSTL